MSLYGYFGHYPSLSVNICLTDAKFIPKRSMVIKNKRRNRKNKRRNRVKNGKKR